MRFATHLLSFRCALIAVTKLSFMKHYKLAGIKYVEWKKNGFTYAAPLEGVKLYGKKVMEELADLEIEKCEAYGASGITL